MRGSGRREREGGRERKRKGRVKKKRRGRLPRYVFFYAVLINWSNSLIVRLRGWEEEKEVVGLHPESS